MKKKIILSGIFFLFVFTFFLALESNQGILNVSSSPQLIRFNSPENITYYFSLTEPYQIFINLSSSFLLSNWNFSLKDIEQNTFQYGDLSYSGESSFFALGYVNATLGYNELTVYGRDINGQIHYNSIIFRVITDPRAPTIENLSDNLYVCENNYFSSFFNCYDPDEDFLTVDINPKSPFYVTPFIYITPSQLVARIYSGILRKSKVGIYPEVITVTDGIYSDYKNINITVIEINNAPIIQNIGVQTIWLVGENSTFDYNVLVNDIEDGNQDSNTLNFSINFSGEQLFNISSSGLMYFQPDNSSIGVHNISVCVEDKGIENIHPNISLCLQNGESITSCINFSLTVTIENRAPTITNYWPNNLTFDVMGNSIVSFNITKYDPDYTIPDSYWYVDDVFTSYYSGNSNDFFNYPIACGVSGTREITAVITDGVLNDSLTWTIEISPVACPVEISGSSGGGGGGSSCLPLLACEEWSACQNSKKSLQTGLISGEDYRNLVSLCNEQNYNEDTCGIQIRSCTDLKNCTKIFSRKDMLQVCFFTLNPSCFDGIKNCHDLGCELLIDCGGPCSPCPTCSDMIKNQGEDDVDCGGPCPRICIRRDSKFLEYLSSFLKDNAFNILLILIILLIILSILYIWRRIILQRKEKQRLVYKYFSKKHE